jgi:hypothetical protein
LQRTRVEGTLPPGLGSATPRVVKRSASHAIKSGPSRRGVPLPPEVAHYWAQSKTTRPDQAASRWAALTGRPGAFELHWIAGGRPLAVRGAVGVCLGRNDVASASRCDWLHGLSSRRSKPRLDPDGLLSLPALAKTLTAERLPTPHGAAVWTAGVARVKASWRRPPRSRRRPSLAPAETHLRTRSNFDSLDHLGHQAMGLLRLCLCLVR